MTSFFGFSCLCQRILKCHDTPATRLAVRCRWRRKEAMSTGRKPVSRAVLRPSLQEDPAQLRFIADHLPAQTVAYDQDLRCVFANRRYAEFYGLSTETIVGRHVREVVGEAAYEELVPYFAEVMRGHRTSYKRVHRLESGEPRYLEIELIPNLAEGGGVRGIFGVGMDVTSRRRDERLRTLGLSTAALIADADTSHTAIRAVIRAICEAEGWDCGRYHELDPDGAGMRQKAA